MRTKDLFWEREHPIAKEGGSGQQRVYKFKNGFGASVVWFKTMFGTIGSYTNEGEWELAVVKFEGEGFTLTYETPITKDVIGHLSEEDVDKILIKISKLK